MSQSAQVRTWRCAQPSRALSRPKAHDAALWLVRAIEKYQTPVTLVCTKACGDMHVPAGACTIYMPLVDHLGNAIEPVCTPEPRWGGYGCLAAPGFLHPRFVRDQLVYFSSDSFGFFLDKAFHRLPDLDGEHAWSAHA